MYSKDSFNSKINIYFQNQYKHLTRDGSTLRSSYISHINVNGPNGKTVKAIANPYCTISNGSFVIEFKLLTVTVFIPLWAK